MRPLLVLVLLAPALLAGCTQAQEGLDDAKQALAEAQQGLADAQREAQEARDRFDRVRSMDVVREERVELRVRPAWDNGTLTFAVANATRSNGDSIPPANVTGLPLLSVEGAGGLTFRCDPLTCAVELADGESVTVRFVDAPALGWTLTAGAPLEDLTMSGARVKATTAAGDATA